MEDLKSAQNELKAEKKGSKNKALIKEKKKVVDHLKFLKEWSKSILKTLPKGTLRFQATNNFIQENTVLLSLAQSEWKKARTDRIVDTKKVKGKEAELERLAILPRC